MPYTQFVSTTPVITQTREAAIDSSRNNLLALRDNVVRGSVGGWTMSQTGGTAENPTSRTWANGTERIRMTPTYSGDQVTQIAWDYSPDSGTNWNAIDTPVFTFDGSNNVTAATNSSFLVAWVVELWTKFKAIRTAYNSHAAAVVASAPHGVGTIASQAANAVALTGGTIDGVAIGGTTRALGTFLQAREIHVATAFGGATTNIPWNDRASTDFTATSTGAAALTFSNLPANGVAASMVVRIVNGGVRTWTWPSGTKWANGSAPTLSTSGTDVLVFFTNDAGASYYASLFGKAFA